MGEIKYWNKIATVGVLPDGKLVVNQQHRIRKVRAKHGSDKYGFYWCLDLKHPETGKHHSFYIHRIVCSVMHPIENEHLYEVNHIDLDKLNYHPDNLEWTTKSQNRKHAYSTGANPLSEKIGDKNGRSKLDWVSVGIIRDALKAGYKQIDISRYFNVSQTAVSTIKLNKNWVI